MKSLSCAFAVMLFGEVALGASFPAPVGGVITIDTDSAVTYDEALPAASKLIKKGVGNATLTVDTTSFSGDVDIQAGTLTLTTLQAVGANTKIEVTGEAATLHLFKPSRPAGAGQDTKFFAGHSLAIRGNGADGTGAFKYTADIAACDDSMLDSLTLTGDASVNFPSRVGIAGPIRLNGHTLTRNGNGYSWMFWKTTTIDAGTIINAAGRLMIQNAPTFIDAANTKIVFKGGELCLYNMPSELKCPVVMSGCPVVVESGLKDSTTVNVFGESFTTTNGNVIVLVDNSARTLSVKGTLDLRSDLYKQGAGKMFLQGPVSSIGDKVIFNQGAGWIVATSDVRRAGFLYCGNGTSGSKFWLGGGSLATGVFRLGNGGTRNSWWQTGGTFSDAFDTPYFGESANSYGAYVMEGGVAAISNTVHVGMSKGSHGVIYQTGGLFEVARAGVLEIGDAGRGYVYVGGGATNDCRMTAMDGTTTCRLSNQGGRADLTVTGQDSLFKADALTIGAETMASTNVVSVTDGATLSARRFFKADNVPAATRVDVWVDGGVIKPTLFSSWNHVGTESVKFKLRSPDKWTVGPKGMTIDTSECTEDIPTKFNASAWPHDLAAPEGRGLATISLPTSGAFVNEAYFGPVFVDIEGPQGSYGASAIAEFDYRTEKLTKVVVSSPGCNYDETTKVYVLSANGATRYACDYTLTEADRTSGPLVKRGAQALTLWTTNTCNGGLIVEEGRVNAIWNKTFTALTPLTVKAGASFSNNGNGLLLSDLAGQGDVLSCGSAGVTVAGKLKITLADAFSEDATPLTCSNKVVFLSGTTVEVSDPENFEKYASCEKVEVLNAPAIEGMPTFVQPTGTVGKWRLSKVGGKLTLGPARGFVIFVR